MRAVFSFALLACVVALWPSAAAAETLAVIVPQGYTAKPMEAAELSLIFWRKKLYKDGRRLQPVNLPIDHSSRRLFSQQILGSLPETQTEYWNILYYHGTSPPHVVHSQEAMLRFVAETPGAIGYVEACRADSRVRVIAWLDENGLTTTRPDSLSCHER